MLVSRYAGYGAYDTKSVSTYNNPDNASSIESADSLNAQPAGTDVANNDSYSDVLSANQAPKHSDPADFTFDFKKEKKFNLEGATRDYEDINVGKALSDMKKDAVLDKYKFFVDSPNLGTDNDGTVRIVRR